MVIAITFEMKVHYQRKGTGTETNEQARDIQPVKGRVQGTHRQCRMGAGHEPPKPSGHQARRSAAQGGAKLAQHGQFASGVIGYSEDCKAITFCHG